MSLDPNLARSFAPYTPSRDDPYSGSLHTASNAGGTETRRPLGSTFATSQQPSFRTTTTSEARAFETRFGWRLDLESAAAYLLGPFGAISLLILETHSNHVRFHAYQSLILSILNLLLHVFLVLLAGGWTSFDSFILFLQIGLFLYLSLRAYRDSETLDRLMIPVVGDFAIQWVEEE